MEELITFETALLAQEKGFKTLCSNLYSINGGEPSDGYIHGDVIQCPTQSVLQKWLRDDHNIDIKVEPFYDIISDKKYQVRSYKMGELIEYLTPFRKYEEALELGLIGSLESL